LLQDVYFLDWTVEPGSQLQQRQEIGAIESKKAEASLYAPIAGRLTTLNPELLDDPSAINVDTYGIGWLFEIDGESQDLLSPDQYVEYLDEVWAVAQRTIKASCDRPSKRNSFRPSELRNGMNSVLPSCTEQTNPPSGIQ
jgi:glycine cleavage system H protein